MNLEREITPLVLTYNEAPNIQRTLSRLQWAKEIVVVDSFSTDETCDLVRKSPQARLIQRKFDNHTNQWNFGLDQVRTKWVLALDADYLLSDELVQELRAERAKPGEVAYFSGFRYCMFGRPLRWSLYPPRPVLFRRDSCRYVEGGHTQVLKVDGPTAFLNGRIYHDDRKPLERWLREQDRYAIKEAGHLIATPSVQLNIPDRLRRRIIVAPALVFVYTLFAKGLIFEGWPGWSYALQRTYAELLLSLRLLEAELLSVRLDGLE